jgi:hypothetical protein
MKVLNIVSLIAILLAPFSLQAADDDGDRRNQIALYLWGAGLSGHLGNKAGGVPVDVEFDDIWKNLEAGYMINYRHKGDKWAFGADYIYLNVTPSADKPPATLDLKQTIFELNVGYEIQPGLELLGGIRGVDIKSVVTFNLGPNPTVNSSADWVDPIVGLDYRRSLSQKWVFYGRGDIGGFGVGSDLTWQLGAYFGYQPSKNWNLFGGYRHLSFDYKDDNANQFFYDIDISGPLLGVGFKFL